MALKYTHFIPENIAPKGAKKIGVYNANGKRIASIPLGRLTLTAKAKKYSFGLISDTHICPDISDTGVIVSERLDNTLTWFEEQGAVFVANCGDMTNVGFENPKGTYNPVQFAEYQRICNLHNLPVYGVCGNHDSYNSDISDYEAELNEYTGHNIRFIVEYEEDVFIFFGQPKASTLYVNGGIIPVPELSWLENQLTTNKNKRCFVFIHPYLTNDSGNPLGVHPVNIAPAPYVHNIIVSALKNHGKAVLFHGHAHFMPTMQELDKTCNYTRKNGFPSVHVPSLGWASYIDNSKEMIKDITEGFGYLVDVYDDSIILNSWDFVRNKPVPIGTYKINISD